MLLLVTSARNDSSRLMVGLLLNPSATAHVRTLTPYELPTAALQVLHHYETPGLPAPQRSYTCLISKLLFIRSTVTHSQAWDLFSHMQYVCCSSKPGRIPLHDHDSRLCVVHPPHPVRALDLLTEMTVNRGIPPTTGTCNAAIFACASPGRPGQQALRW